jgi:putative two-component system response regulator
MSAKLGSAKILVVDDEPANCKLAIGILEPLGHQIGYATNGSDALVLAAADPPDVILLDIMMPDMNGYEVARSLKASPTTRGTSIVMITALDGAKERVAAFEAGADDFLSKPVDIDELRYRIKALIVAKAYQDQMRSQQQDLEHLVETKTRDLKIAREKIKASAVDTLYRLVAASEYKDSDTGGHIGRVSLYAGAIARKLGLDAAQVADIEVAAPMHDIGKLGIPDAILLKPGPLTQEEWIVMKQHSLIGAQILKGSEAAVIQLAEQIALTHHERWDGNGYPGGLRQNEIPLAGRIVAVADVFDALCSKRPYRDAYMYPFEQVFSVIQAGRGTQFDPAVVDALLAVQDDILTIHSKAHQ